MISVFFEDSFDSAHRLPNVPADHKCANWHGHTYRVRIEVTGDIGPHSGWVVDYAEVRAAWLPLKEKLDHHSLNEIHGLKNPTCELIAAWIAENLNIEGLSMIELRESEHCGVVYLP